MVSVCVFEKHEFNYKTFDVVKCIKYEQMHGTKSIGVYSELSIQNFYTKDNVLNTK